MVEAGDILDVEVRSVAVFGLFCSAGEQEVLVLIPETSWVASYCSCLQFAAEGDRFRVQVLHADAASGKVSASLKAIHPDPWPSGRLAVGTMLQARVVRAIESADRCGNGPGNLLELLPGAFVVLCGESSVVVGQSCPVRVVASDFSRRDVRVALAECPVAKPNAAEG
jgi:predicted RNA-binding protein with RPS1 domain